MIFGKKAPVQTSPEVIDEFLSRGIENIYPSKEFLKAKLAKGEQLSIYFGIDPTGPTLHIGHVIALMKLQQWQKMGHKVILLIGDFTGMIGDPTDKTATRKQLTHAEVLHNAKLYKSQASRFLSFSGPNKAELKYNSTWLKSLNLEDILNLLSKVTVDQMLKRDMFEKRMSEGKPVYLHEFLYPVMQGYDSVAMNVDGEIGGNDQTFNMLTGRTLMKEINAKEKFVITVKLLADQTGKKMGKSENNMIALTDSPTEMFGKVMSWTDGMILPGFELATPVPSSELALIKQTVESSENPRNIKMRLAKEIVTLYHSRDAAEKAEQNFITTFSNKGTPDNLEPITAQKDALLVDIALSEKIVASKSEWRRLLDEGAVSNLDTGEKITDPFAKVTAGVFKIGKRRFINITLK